MATIASALTACDRVTSLAERVGMRGLRRALVAHAHHRVLEVGMGKGTNLAFYPSDCQLVAIDADRGAVVAARATLTRAPCAVALAQMDGHQLALADRSFDAVVCTLVLCTVADPQSVLAEIKRVLKPGGQLLLVEHVRSTNRLLAALQCHLTPSWSRSFGGCCLNRDTASAIGRAGFRVTYARRWLLGSVLFGVYEAP